MGMITLASGEKVLVDDDLMPVVTAGRAWFLDGRGYVVRHRYAGGVRKMEKLHQLAMEAKPGEIVDHRSHDLLDNRRSNLRKSNYSLNGANRQKQKGKTSSIFKGVSRRAAGWEARIKVNGKLIGLGTHKTETGAAKAYNAAALRYFGDHALISVID